MPSFESGQPVLYTCGCCCKDNSLFLNNAVNCCSFNNIILTVKDNEVHCLFNLRCE